MTMTHDGRLKSLLNAAKLSLILTLLLLTACAPAAVVVVPTARPTATPSPTAAPTSEAATVEATPTPPPTLPPTTPTGGPSPTPLFGAPAAAPATAAAQMTRPIDPNAPRIEFFTTDVLSAVPGQVVNLYWSTRNTTSAVIYRLERGVRNQVWNVGPDGNLSVQTRLRDRGALDFILSVGDGTRQVEQSLSIPLTCPDVWFFQPPPEACPDSAAAETRLIEQPFERGRLLYNQSSNNVYALFNDGSQPAWIVLPNRFDPAIHPEFEASFVPPPGFYQPVRVLGFLWRGNDVVRNRLGLGIQPEFAYDGFAQTATSTEGDVTLYASSADGTVLELLPEGERWQIITPP